MLTPEEEKELALLEQEEAQFQQMNTGLTPEEEAELAQLEAEEAQMSNFQIDPTQEADLGFALRSRFAIEPLQTNRAALLIEELGQENVMQDQEGNLFVRDENNIFKPVNAPGVSPADIADIAGALPESVGGLIGGAGGAVGGAVGGAGVGAIPGAIAGGVAGGAAGSAARQGLSALLGTPQVADIGERAKEVALSGAFGGVAAGLGSGAKTVARKVFPKVGIDKAFKNASKRVGIKATKGQLAGGRELDLEKQLAETPFFGRGIKNKINKQITQIKTNLKDDFSNFDEIDFDRTGAGGLLKDNVDQINSAIKFKASDLFDEVAEKGTNVNVRSDVVRKSLAKNLGDIKILDDAGMPLNYNAKSGLTRDQFNKVQSVAMDVLDSLDETAKMSNGLVNANEINTLRKVIDSNIRETGKQGLDDVALLRLREGFMNVTEDMLGAQSKGLKKDFQAARGLWSRYLKNKRLIEKDLKIGGVKDLSDEKVLQRVFRDKKSLEQLKEIADDRMIEEAGTDYVKSILSKRLGADEQISAIGALKALRDKREVLQAALGNRKYQRLIDNLEVLDRIGKPINPSRTAITQLQTEVLKGLGLMARRAGKSVAEPSADALASFLKPSAPLISEPISRDLTFQNLFNQEK
jgi:hypothetical protein